MTTTTDHPTDLVPSHGVNIDILTRPFPPEAIKQREGGGRRKLSYVEAHTVIRRLNEATGFNWSFSVLKETMEGDVLKAHVCLTIPGLGSREHVGVQKINANGGEDLLKGAVSDGLKKAATLFGVGLELYGDDYEADAAEVQRRAEERRQQDRENNAPSPEVKRAAAAFVADAHSLDFDVMTKNEPDGRKALTLAAKVLGLSPVPPRLTADQWARATAALPTYGVPN